MKKLLILLILFMFSSVFAQYDPPSAYTEHYRLRMWVQGLRPGADSLNANWRDIDMAIYSTRAHVDTLYDSLKNEIQDSILNKSRDYIDFVVQDSVVASAPAGDVRFFYRSAFASNINDVLTLNSLYGFVDLSVKRHVIQQNAANIIYADDKPYDSFYAFNGMFNLSSDSCFTFRNNKYTIAFWFKLSDGDSAKFVYFDSGTPLVGGNPSTVYEIGTHYDPSQIYFNAGGNICIISGFLYD